MQPTIKTRLKRGIIGLGVGLGATLTAAGAQASNHITTGGIAPSPIGHVRFCSQFPEECKRLGRARRPHLTKRLWKEVVAINGKVNRLVQPVTDAEYYATEEFWTYPGAYGDCEDYALMKRHLLIKAGWNPANLLIAVVRQSDGSGHAVLTVRTRQGDFVLDNLDGTVRRWAETPYRYVRLQSPNHAGRWLKVVDRRARF